MIQQGKSLHAQISDWILSQINGGVLKPDQKIPSENDLAMRFNVSRVTVRRALQTLESESVIYRCQGLGSFVSDFRSPQTMIRLTDFSEDMKKAGLKATSKVVAFVQEPASLALAERLDIKEGQLVVRVDRLRMGDNEPIAYDITWLPMRYGQLLESEILSEKTIYDILEVDYEIPILRGAYRISAENAPAEIAGFLKVPTGTALMLIKRASFTLGGKPVYYQKRFYRSDKVVYEMLLERTDGDSQAFGSLPLKDFSPIFEDSNSF
jgi:GntR family transcriptional regulator